MPNGNGNKKIWIGVGIALLAGFLSFTAHRIFVYAPDCYATKEEVRQMKQDIKEDLRYIRNRLDRVLDGK